MRDAISFFGVPPGSYRVTEVVGEGFVQTWPHSVSYAVDLVAFQNIWDLDFGNSRCGPAIVCIDSCLAGRPDDFAIADGPEPTTVSPGLDEVISNCSSGPLYIFDQVPVNRCFGYTFYETGLTCWQDPACLAGARLILRMKGGNTLSNDSFSLREDGEIVWSIGMNQLQSIATNGVDQQWTNGDVSTFYLDLADLPPWRGITNVLATLQDGDLDIMVSDDTGVDYAKLVVEKCGSPTGVDLPAPHRMGLWARVVPNPLNPRTHIEFATPVSGRTNLSIYDVRGRRVITLLDEYMTAGRRSVPWDGRDDRGRMQSAGVYFFRLQCEGMSLTGKALLLK